MLDRIAESDDVHRRARNLILKIYGADRKIIRGSKVVPTLVSGLNGALPSFRLLLLSPVHMRG